MKKHVVALLILICLSCSVFAKNPPLRVAINAFAPPFVMQSGQNTYYGFDIALVEYVCQALDRPCEYLPMDLEDLIPTLQAQKADIALGGMVFTQQYARLVRFSTPYLISKAQFIATDKARITSPFTLKQLDGKQIGVLNGSAFERALRVMNIPRARIITFEKDSDMVDALRARTLDLGLLSAPKAHYWQGHSAGLFKTIGNPFPIGFGFAIAIDPTQDALIQQINLAVINYHESQMFKQNRALYFPERF